MRKLLLALAFAILAARPAFAACSAIPALPDTERRTEYTGVSSSTGPFNISFQIYGDSTDYGNWIEVWVNGVKKTAVTDYTVTSPSGALGSLCLPISNAQVTFTAAQSGTIEIVGARRPRRTSQFSENRGVTAHDLNQVMSDLTAMERERWDFAGRVLRAPPGETLSVLPTATSRASTILGFDASGQPSAVSPSIGLGTVIGPASSTDGHVVVFDGTTGTKIKDGGPAIGTVTSVGLSLPGIFSVSGSPVTGSGTLTGALANQNANKVFAGPSTGAAAAPTFRSLVAADIPFSYPMVDVKTSFGAKGDGSTDDTTAIQNAINSIGGGLGGAVSFPPGVYCVNSGITVSTAAVHLWSFGGSNTSVQLSACGSDVTPVTLNAFTAGLHGIQVLGPGITGTHPALVLGSSCTECIIEHARAQGGTNAIKIQASDFLIFDVHAESSYGSALVYVTGSGFFDRLKADQTFPVSTPSNGAAPSAWTNAHAYTTGAIVSNSGFYIQVTNNCTSGGSNPTNQNYAVNITDNTCIWKLIAPTTYYSTQLDTGVSFTTMRNGDHTGPFTAGVYISNTLAGTAPQSILITDETFGLNWSAGLWGHDGSNLLAKGLQISNCLVTQCAGVLLSNSWTGDTTIANSLIFTNPFGINISNGTNTAISGNTIVNSSSAGVVVQAAISKFTITSNNLGSSALYGANTIGVQILAGASNDYTISNNDFQGAGTAISDSGSGARKIVFNTGVATAQQTTDLMFPTVTRAGDVAYYNGTHWVTLAGNNAGTKFLQEDASGTPSWVTSTGSPCTTTANSVQYTTAGTFGCVAGVTSNGTVMTFADGDMQLSGASSGTTTVKASATGGGTATFFSGSDTIAGKTLANGGTNNALTASNGGIVWSDASKLNILAGTATASQMLQSGASATPAWTSNTWPATNAQGDIIYGSASNVLTVLAKATTATRYLANTGASNNPAWDQINLANGVTGTLANANLTGTGSVTVAGATCTLGSTCGLTSATNTLGAPVNLNNSSYTDGPSAANGTTGTWFASGTVTVTGTTGDAILCELWDGTTVIASSNVSLQSGTGNIALSGILTTPAANIRISCENTTANRGTMASSNGLTTKASTVTAFRIN